LSRLPARDDEGRQIGFHGTLKIHPKGQVIEAKTPVVFFQSGGQHEWHIPAGERFGDHVAAVGAPLVVGTRGLGWWAKIPLPGKGERIDTAKDPVAIWKFSQKQFDRARLIVPKRDRGDD
jgi:hypothetical protein